MACAQTTTSLYVRRGWIHDEDATAARKAHNRVVEVDPGYTDARLVQGVHDYIIGSLPFHLKILGFIAGFHGDRESGMKALQLVAERAIGIVTTPKSSSRSFTAVRRNRSRRCPCSTT